MKQKLILRKNCDIVFKGCPLIKIFTFRRRATGNTSEAIIVVDNNFTLL